MKPLSIDTLAGMINAEIVRGCESVPSEVTGVSTDSRTINSGDCFFAIKGDNFDGHNFIAQDSLI